MGGQQKVLLTIAKELSKKHEVTIYYENHSFFDLSGLQIIRPKKMTQIKNLVFSFFQMLRIKSFSKKILANIWHYNNMKDALKKEEFDITILLNPYILFVNEVKNGLFKTKKVVCWTHNQFEIYLNSYFFKQQDQLIASMRSCDQIVALEKHTALNWEKINKNTVIIHNPVTIDNNNQNSDLNSKIISCVGRIDVFSKGLDLLCEVVKYLDSDIVIEFAGGGTKKEENYFKRLIKENNLEEKIILKGKLKGEELSSHYKRGSLFLMTSRHEGFPLVAAEAMVFGLPFIGFDIPSLREVTNNGESGILIENFNIMKMANQINELFKNKRLLLDFSRASLHRTESLSLDSIVEEWEEKVIKI